MRKIILLAFALSTFSLGMSTKCERYIGIATEVHWKYVIGEASLKDTYNATKKAEKVCGFKLK